MKEIILLLCGFIISHQLYAQTFAEWMEQNHTQLKYLGAQIAALKGYDGLLQKGYETESAGLDSIGSIDEDELLLHANYLAGLDRPGAAVQEVELVEGIRQYCTLLPYAADEIESAFKDLPSLPYDWPEIGTRLRERLQKTVAQAKEFLEALLTDDRYRMDDAGRLRRLRGIYTEMRKTYGDIMFLLGEVDIPGANRPS